MKMQSADSRAGFMVADSSHILKRFYFLLRETVLAQAGWMPGTRHWEIKLLWPEFLWQDSQIAHGLRERVLELRYPERAMEPGTDEAFLQAWRNLLRNTPGDAAFARAMIFAVKPFLREAFVLYLDHADAIGDGPTVRILRQAIEDIDEQSERAREAMTSFGEVYDAETLRQARAWEEQVAGVLATVKAESLLRQDAPEMAGGGAESRPFSIARLGVRDPRFSYSRIPWPDSLDPKREAGVGFELQVRQAQAHLNEVWAAEMASAVIFDLADDGPPEFLTDAARWCYDEVRHCRMGYARFLEWGFQKQEMPMGSFSYDAGARLDPVTRLGVIFYFETTYIHTKSERTRSFAEFGDRTSSHDMDFDWADELIHTFYGKKWLEYFLKKEGSVRKTQEIKRAAEGAVAELRAEATAADKQRVGELYEATMRRARELAEVPRAA